MHPIEKRRFDVGYIVQNIEMSFTFSGLVHTKLKFQDFLKIKDCGEMKTLF